MRCPKCKARIIQKGRDGTLKVRTSLVAIRASRTEVVCRSCGADVPIDLLPGEDLVKVAASAGPRLVVSRDGNLTPAD